MQARETDQVDGHTTLGVYIDVGFLSPRQIGGKAWSQKTGQPFMRDVEELWGHMRRRKVIAKAQGRDVILVKATGGLVLPRFGRH